MFKFKNFLKVLGAFTLVVPMAALGASCQRITRYDQENYLDKNGVEKIRIITNFGPNTDQKRYKALQYIIDEYNKYLDENPNDPELSGALKVEANFNVGQSYNEIYNNVRTKIVNKDTKTLGNLVLNYPSTAVFLGSHDMILDLTDINTEIVNNSTIDSYKILGLDETKKWILPFGQSSEVLSINKSLLGYILNILDEKYKEKHSDSIISQNNNTVVLESLNLYRSKNSKVKNYLESLWKLGNLNEIDFGLFSNKKIDDTIITTYDGMLSFSIFISNLLNKIKNTNNVYVIGIDNPVNELFMQLYNKANNNFNDYYLKPLSSKKHLLNYYETIKNKNLKEHKDFISFFKKYIDLANTGRFYTQFDSSSDFNSTTLQTQHVMLFSISSSLAYNYVKFAPDSYSYKNQTISYLGIGDWYNNIASLGKNGFNFNLNIDSNSNYTAWKNTKNNNSAIYLTNKNIEEINNFAPKNTKLKILHNSNESKTLFIKNKEDFQRFYVATKTPTENDIKLINEILVNIKNVNTNEELNKLEAKLPRYFTAYWLLKNFKELDKEKEPSMKLEDSYITTVPIKNYETDKNKGTYIVQGPSIIGIHANDKADKASKIFLNWLYSKEHKLKMTIKNGSKQIELNLSPIEMFAYLSGYLFPSQNFINEFKKTKINPFVMSFLQNLENSINENGPVPYQDIADLNSNSYRESVNSILNQAIRAGMSNEKLDIEKAIELLLNSIHTYERV